MKTRKHYVIVTETYPPEINGVALTVRNLARGLVERGHRVSLVRPRQPGEAGALSDVPAPATDIPGLLQYRVHGLRLPRYPGLQFGLPAGGLLHRLWQLDRPDALYVATEGPLGLSAVSTARRLGIPAATGLHTRFDEYMRSYGLGALEGLAFAWMRWFHNRANATLVPTRALADFVGARGFNNPRVLSRAVDPKRFSPAHRDDALRASLGLAPQDLAVLYVGRIAAEKNLPLAVASFQALQKHRPDARFIWVGDGPQLASLKAAHPDFIFCGLQQGHALARHIASCDLFLFPSRSETFGNVTLEAMASGVATVAFNEGAAREHLRTGLHGAAVEHDADFMRAACALACDDAGRRRQGLAASTAMQTLHPGQVAASLDGLLGSLGRHDEQEEVAPCNRYPVK